LSRVGRVLTQQAETRCEAALGAATCGQKRTKERGTVAAARAGLPALRAAGGGQCNTTTFSYEPAKRQPNTRKTGCGWKHNRKGP
jgi:hypothetical protein